LAFPIGQIGIRFRLRPKLHVSVQLFVLSEDNDATNAKQEKESSGPAGFSDRTLHPLYNPRDAGVRAKFIGSFRERKDAEGRVRGGLYESKVDNRFARTRKPEGIRAK